MCGNPGPSEGTGSMHAIATTCMDHLYFALLLARECWYWPHTIGLGSGIGIVVGVGIRLADNDGGDLLLVAAS